VITVIGAAVLSSTFTLIRKRPSGATSYCCRNPVLEDRLLSLSVGGDRLG
jgi:hypothetical protein